MPWIDKALKRMHRNLVAIALANKLARIAWAVLARGHAYQPRIGSMPRDMNALGFTKRMDATPLRPPRSPVVVSERRWLRGDGFT